jgi:probable RNA 2'-phosphotransferase
MTKIDVSKLMSYILRHNPMRYKINMDTQGYVNTEDLITAVMAEEKLSHDETYNIIKDIVSSDKKQRFSFSDGESKIRANQGHSLDFVDIEFETIVPDCPLYHGTTIDNYKKIMTQGLLPMERQYVHLTPDLKIAKENARRWGRKSVILKINHQAMLRDKFEFLISKNKVYLTDHIPPEYITVYN